MFSSVRSRDIVALGYILLLVAVMAFGMLSADPSPNDDFFYFQRFIETLAGGELDLSIPGFHGMNILTVPWYLLTRSPLAQIEFQMLSGMLLPLFAFLAVQSLFRSLWHGIVFATVIAMMPFLSFSALRGWMVALYNVLFFLTIFAAARGTRWWWLPWGFAIISLPFAVALLPLLVVLTLPADKLRTPVWMRSRTLTLVWQYRHLLYGLAIPVLYVVFQYVQAGKINVGVHQELDQFSVWQGPTRMFLNLTHTLQILFSVHNYYFVDPANTGHGNMLQTTPVLVFLGLFALFGMKEYFPDRRFGYALLLGAIIGIGLNVALDHMDHFYMETGVFFLILAALPVLKRYPLWIPLALVTLHFQWFYFFLQHGEAFRLGWEFFAVPAAVDVCFLLWCVVHPRNVQAIVALLFPIRSGDSSFDKLRMAQISATEK